MSDQVWWYATRAAGLMTWFTAVVAVIIGLLLSTRIVKNRTGPWLLDLHRFLSGISVLFLAAHLTTLYFDSFEDFGPRELFIPGESTWNPEAAAWGIIAAFALVLVEVTSLLRKWLSPSVWRMFHMLSIVTVAAGSYHAWLGGTDVANPLTYLIAGAGSVMVVLLVGIRLRRAGNDDHMTADRSSREALLLEMRQRLEDLPIPDTKTEAELDTSSTASLPRRAAGANPGGSPFDETPLQPGQVHIPSAGAVPAAPPAPPAAPTDAFAAVPLGDESPDLGTWVAPENESPFGRAPLDPFADDAGTTEPDFTFGQSAPDPFLRGDDTPPPVDGDSPFAGSPFESAPAPQESEAPSPFGEPAAPPVPTPEPFTPVTEQPVTNPFSPAEPTPQALSVEVPATDATPAVAADGPPPLPESAIDPATGEPDQAAYQAWLVDWLAFAERYGEETPDDPSRV